MFVATYNNRDLHCWRILRVSVCATFGFMNFPAKWYEEEIVGVVWNCGIIVVYLAEVKRRSRCVIIPHSLNLTLPILIRDCIQHVVTMRRSFRPLTSWCPPQWRHHRPNPFPAPSPVSPIQLALFTTPAGCATAPAPFLPVSARLPGILEISLQSSGAYLKVRDQFCEDSMTMDCNLRSDPRLC